MNHLHPKLKRLLSLVVMLALMSSHAAISQPTVSNAVDAYPQVLNAPLTPITGVTSLPEQKVGITVFPNPAGESITVQSYSAMHLVSIVDILGRTIKQFKPDQLQLQVNVADLLPGRYFISIKQQDSAVPIIKSFVKI